MRTHYCGELTTEQAGESVTLCGWVDRRRDLGGVVFLGLRDRAGVVQVVAEPDSPAFADAERLRNEFCVRITGAVRQRPESQWNDDMATGVLRAAHQMGVEVPTALSVAGFDDIPLAQQIYPALTTIRQPLRKMAETASLALIRGAQGQTLDPSLEIVPGTIQVRDSTAPPRA